MKKFTISRKVIFGGILVISVVVVAVFFAVYLPSQATEAGSGTGPLVAVREGTLQGQWVDGVQGNNFKYAAFRGIPFAERPERFKGPRPKAKWDGIRMALMEGNLCYQSLSGSEDCLYLNVYSPKLPRNDHGNPKLPVYFFIHGGIFQFGSSTAKTFGPDFLVQQDIVVVTTNYRLGVFGFLSRDTDDMPGNIALKDQVAALRWVHDNIARFGGDPAKVTLGGHSAGAVSAGWLTLLPATEGLMRSAIIQSGGALHSWNLNVHNKEFAKEVVTVLTGMDINDEKIITQVLQNATAHDLYNAAENATSNLRMTRSLGNQIVNFYLPSLELRTSGGREEKLIERDAESYVIKRARSDIPIIFGETTQEWAQIYIAMDIAHDTEKMKDAIEHLITRVPSSIKPGAFTQKLLQIEDWVDTVNDTTIEDSIRDHFFNNQDIGCNTECSMAKYLDQAYITADTTHWVRLRAKYSDEPTYGYVFSLKSDYNNKPSLPMPQFLENAVAHGDDMGYIWHSVEKSQDYHGSSIASRALRRQVAMWTNFIKDMNPTPKVDDVITSMWIPMKRGDEEKYLDINIELTMRNESMGGSSTPLWNTIFNSYRKCAKDEIC